jgi:putative N6-adenine-specific DNA methylase
MQLFTDNSRIIITCNKRLSPYLTKEVEELGFKPVRLFSTGVELFGNITDCIKLNLQLRCASQVLYSLKTFSASDPDTIYNVLVELPWEEIINDQSKLTVTSNVDHPSIRTPLFANLKVKDAIVDRMRTKKGVRPDSGPEADGAVVHLYWKEEHAEIFVDTSGETLAKHGYRKIPGKAPMLEALAAATLLASVWDRQAPFINPMCGSGTVAIEAALIATNRRPGLYRNNYAFMHLKGYDQAKYSTERKKLEEQIQEKKDLTIIASDISEDAIHITRANAAIAGVEELIRYQVCDFEATELPEVANGLVYFNPEYGERLGVLAELEETYGRIGDFMKKKCSGYTGYIFTGNLDLAKKIGLKAKRKIEFYTGKIDCRLLEYELYKGTRDKKVQVTSEAS